MNSKSSTQMTTESGIPVADNQNSITAGSRGPVLMQDVHLFEKMAHFNRERVPERVVHAKGSGAYGRFTVTGDLSSYTCAQLFSKVGGSCETFVRFSTVAGELGSADTVRDPRGFAVKFYTEEGNWDLVGNNTPVFFVRDPLKFSDFIHSQKRNPVTGRRDNTMQWDFWSCSPESLHQVTWLFGDRGIPASYRHMNGYGSHTFSLWNAQGERFWVKWHLKTQQGIQNLTAADATELSGSDPDFHRRDLFDAIERGEYPKWTVYVQVMPEAQADSYRIHPFDLTKVWPHSDYPLIEAGVLELNRNPRNYFAEVEQAAFEPGNLPPGFGASPDKMLQARLQSYADAHRYRIGVNYGALEVNRPRCPVHTYHRDGAMRFDGNGGDQPVYEPNSFAGPVDDFPLQEPPLRIVGDGARYNHRDGNEDTKQAGNLFRLMDEAARDRLMTNMTDALKSVPESIQKRWVLLCFRADTAYGDGLCERLGIDRNQLALPTS